MQTSNLAFFTESRAALIERLAPVTSRCRKIRFWRIVAVTAIIATIVATLLLSPARSGQISGHTAACWIAGLAIAALTFAFLLAQVSIRNPRPVAVKVEQHFPGLQQRLLTGLSQSGDDAPLGYLQQRVIREAREHSRTHRWADAVPAKNLWLSRLSGAGASIAMIFVLGLLASSAPLGVASVASRRQPEIKVTVVPGNTEVERGSSLVVTARFERSAPDEAVLLCTSGDGEQRRITMTQNLNDPVLGGFVASVDNDFDYQIITDQWTSDVFSVNVFEFPSLLRSDANLKFPDYTGLDEKRIEDTVRVSAVEGTKVKWICFLNKPVAAVDLVSKDGTRIELAPDAESASAWSTEFELQQTQRLTLEIIDDDDRENKYPPELIARVLPNHPPKLKIVAARDVSVSPLEELPLGVEVRDDYGVQQVGISYSFGDHLPHNVPLEQSIARGIKKEIEHLIEFEALKARPDQLFSYYFWAEDVGPDGHPRRTETDMFFAEVRPFEQIYRQGQQPPGGAQQQQNQNGQKAERLAELQKEIVNATWKVLRSERGPKRSEQFPVNVDLLMESQAGALGQLEELTQEVEDAESRAIVDSIRGHMNKAISEISQAKANSSPDPLNPAMVAEKSSYADLLKLRAREFEVSRQRQQQQSQQSRGASQRQRQQQLDDLELDQDENRYETQQQAQQNQQEEQQQRETRQVLNRLRDLARRQEDLNKQLAQLQSALEQAETEEEIDEIERQLKRLREQQQDLLRETDELSERMQQPENQEEMREANEKLDQTRENIRNATEALEQNDASEALTAGRRAEREFEELRDEFRQRTAGQFNEAVREMRSAVQHLDDREVEISEQLKAIHESKSSGLRGDNKRSELQESLSQQRKDLKDLLQQIQDTVVEAETAEPLLAQKLYDSYRKSQTRQIDRKLQDTSLLLQRGFDVEAREFEKVAREDIGELREELEEAASSILGDETEGLRRALSELEQLTRDLENEIDRQAPDETPRGFAQEQGDLPGQSREGQQQQELNQGRQQQDGQQDAAGKRDGSRNDERQEQERDRQASQRTASGQPGQQNQQGESSDQEQSQQEQSGQQAQSQQNQNEQNQPGQGQSQQGQQPGQQQQSQQQPVQQPSGRSPQDQRSQQQQSRGREGSVLNRFAADSPSSSPIMGDGFREWSDRLRDVEEMVENPELRSDAARIRERIRDVRVELRRHAKAPQWALVETMIAQPLRELKRNVQEELLRRSAEKNALVPIDRDPVPDQFSDAVRQYYENLGSGR